MPLFNKSGFFMLFYHQCAYNFKGDNMYRQTKEEVLKQLKSSINGLTLIEAKTRLQKNGKNTLSKEKKKNFFKVFFTQLIDPLIYVLLAGFVLSMFLKEYSDGIIILLVILLNASLSTFQELKADKALKALSSLTHPTALVKRENKIIEIKADEIVVGDILILEAGRTVAADVRLLTSNKLLIDESSLTGESIASEKNCDALFKENTELGDQKNMAFMSTLIINGSGEGVVVHTGMNTQIGKIAKLLKEEKKSKTPLQKKLNEISRVLAITTVFLCVFIFVIALWQKRNSVEMLITAISLAVAVIPEGLLACVTIVLSLGVQKLSKVNAIVKKLPSVETLGCVNIICSDKTGTLTLNKMRVTHIMVNQQIFFENEDLKQEEVKLLAKGMLSCNDASINDKQEIGDPTEIALIQYFSKYKIAIEPRKNEIPFDSERKMMSTLHHNIQYSKGALDKILPLCNQQLYNGKIIALTANEVQKIYQLHDQLSSEGLRILSLAYKMTSKIDEKNLIFVGLVAMIDPPRKEVAASIENLHKAHIQTLMITGDHKNTALAIAKKLNIAHHEDEVITGTQLDQMTPTKLKDCIEQYKVFARVSPENKMQIVKALKENGKVVAMSGDGVNDAPSLKAANIGIAMGINGTDVSKNASDMVLMDDNFTTIEKAVKEGRGIFNNIKKTLLFLLSSNIGEVLVMLFAIILNLPIPLIAIHILWVNLLTDTLPSLALGQDKVYDDVMNEHPRNINESIFAHKGYFIILIYGLIIGLLSFASYLYVPLHHLMSNNLQINIPNIIYLLKNNQEILIKAQTFAFSTLALSQLFHSFGMKNIKKSLFSKETFNNKLLNISLLFGILIQLAVTMIPFLNTTFKTSPLTIIEFIIILLFSMIPLYIHELVILFTKSTKKND